MTYVPHSSLFTAGPSRYGPCSHMIPTNSINRWPETVPTRTLHPTPPLPSPISPPTSPLACPAQILSKHIDTTPSPSTANSSCSSSDSATTLSNLVPIRGFIHEVLRCSCTSATVLQTALCYLEAICSKMPDLVRQEQSGDGSHGEPGYANCIIITITDTPETKDSSPNILACTTDSAATTSSFP